MAKGRFENALGSRPAPELLELALCKAGELEVALKYLARLARGNWARTGCSRRSRPPVIVIPVPPSGASSRRRRKHARAG
ncbi:MAG: hypothetical protein NTW87_11200 [Planctomycetota bacterium]|nr:hypothetical protein [Planctomycetota bacterium]